MGDDQSQFLIENWKEFEQDLGTQEGVNVEKIIIVNYPFFSGQIFDDVPVADFYLFLSYFKSGGLSQIKLEPGKKLENDFIPYYDSFNTFGGNFGKFFKCPVPISKLIERQFIEKYVVTPNDSFKVSAQRVVYKERTS